MEIDSIIKKNNKDGGKEIPIIAQIFILTLICLLGEILAFIIPINCSSAVYDFILVYLLLQFKVIRLEWIEKISDVLAGCMLLAFVPGTVSIVNEMDQLLKMIFPTLIASTIGSVLVLLASGWTVQLLTLVIQKIKKKVEKNGDIRDFKK